MAAGSQRRSHSPRGQDPSSASLEPAKSKGAGFEGAYLLSLRKSDSGHQTLRIARGPHTKHFCLLNLSSRCVGWTRECWSATTQIAHSAEGHQVFQRADRRTLSIRLPCRHANLGSREFSQKARRRISGEVLVLGLTDTKWDVVAQSAPNMPYQTVYDCTGMTEVRSKSGSDTLRFILRRVRTCANTAKRDA